MSHCFFRLFSGLYGLFFALFGFLAGCVHAQSASDSLYAVLEALPDDTAKVGQARRAGGRELFGGDIEMAKRFFLLSLHTAEKTGDLIGEAHGHQTLVQYYKRTNEVETSIRHAEKSAEIFFRAKAPGRAAFNLNQAAFQYNKLGNYTKAIELVYRAMAINDSLHLYANLINDYYTLAICYRDLENNPVALQWCNKAMATAKTHAVPDQLAIIGNTMGTILASMNRFAEAERAWKEAVARCPPSVPSNIRLHCAISTNLGEMYADQNKLDLARKTLKETLPWIRKIKFVELEVSTLRSLGRVEMKATQYGSAKAYLDSASRIANNSGFNAISMTIAETQAELYERMGDTTKANAYLRIYSVLRDSLYNPEHLAAISELRADYEKKLKYREITALRTQQWIGGGIALSLLLMLGLLLYALRQRNRRLALEAEQQRIRAEMELAEQTALTELRESELRYASEMLASKNQLLLNLRELMAQNAAGNTRKLRDDLGALISAIQADLAPQPTAARPEDAAGENTNQLDILLPGFLERMQAQYPALSRNELRLAAYIRLGYSTRDIAALLSIEVGSVEVARYRLRKKLPLSQGSALGEFLESI